jgi:hypothetical protein
MDNAMTVHPHPYLCNPGITAENPTLLHGGTPFFFDEIDQQRKVTL